MSPMATNTDIDYAMLVGPESVTAAIVFSAFYVLLFGWFVCQLLKTETYVFILLCSFCAVRISAFIILATLARSDPARRNLSLLIDDKTLFDVGYFTLFYSAHTLVLDLTALCASLKPTSMLGRLAASQKLFKVTIAVAVVLGVYGVSQSRSSTPFTVDVAQAFRKANTVIFLVLTILQVYQTLRLTQVEIPLYEDGESEQSWGMKHGSYLLCAISLLLLTRQVFATATMSDLARQYNEHFQAMLSYGCIILL